MLLSALRRCGHTYSVYNAVQTRLLNNGGNPSVPPMMSAGVWRAGNTWLTHLLTRSIPKYFGRFARRTKAPSSGGRQAENGPSSSGGEKSAQGHKQSSGGGGGKGGGDSPKIPNFNPFSEPVVPIIVITGLVTLHLLTRKEREKEITFETARVMIVAGVVERLEVVNEKRVRVFWSLGEGANSDTWKDQSESVEAKKWGDPPTESVQGLDEDKYANKSAPLQETLVQEGLGGAKQNREPVFFTIGSIDSFERKLQTLRDSLDLGDDVPPVTYTREGGFFSIFMSFAPTLLLIGFFALVMRNAAGGGASGGIFGITNSRAKKYTELNRVKITFKDVAGMAEAKQEVMEFVSFLRNPSRFTDLGAKIPKGAILLGPPGTGKTLLAKAVAGECKVPFYSISGSDFMEMFVGVGPARVRDLFSKARENRPCIVYIDEIDAIGKPRGKGGFFGGNDERENTLNQLLIELDGFNVLSDVVVLASTNVGVDNLDKALMRPGRFDRQIMVDLPNIQEREEIFHVHLRPVKMAHDSASFIAKKLAQQTPGFSGADIANVCNEGALIAARRDAKEVTLVDFEAAVDRVIGGLEKKTRVLRPEEKRVVAFHEAGHAITSWFLQHCHPLVKVSIIPRGSAALGYAQYLPSEKKIRTVDELMDTICMALGGRAAERLTFNHLSTGAQDDLQRVTRMAYAQVTKYGFSEKLLNLAFPEQGNSSEGLTRRLYSDSTALVVDQEVKRIVNEAYARTERLLHEHAEDLRKVAEFLMEKEIMSRDEMESLIGKRPFPPTEEEIMHSAVLEGLNPDTPNSPQEEEEKEREEEDPSPK